MSIKKDEVNEPFYEIIFDAREDKGRTISNEKKWSELDNIKKEHEKILNEFISKRVHPKARKNLTHLIQNVLDAMDDREDFENQQYYYCGMKDALEILIFLFGDIIKKS